MSIDKNIEDFTINKNYIDIYRGLYMLTNEILKTEQISSQDKLIYIEYIQEIDSQHLKSEPDKTVIKQILEKLKCLGTISEVKPYFEKIIMLTDSINN